MINLREKIKDAVHSGDPKTENELDIERLKEITGESSLVYEDMYIAKDAYVQFMAIGTNGVFIIVPFESEDDRVFREHVRHTAKIREFFSLNKKNSFIFYYSDEDSYYMADEPILLTGEVIGSEDSDDLFYDAFANLYDNLFRPYIDVAFIDFKSVVDMLKAPSEPEEYKPTSELNGRSFTYAGEEFVLDADSSDESGDTEPGYVRDILTYEEDGKNLIDDIAAKCERLQGNGRPIGNTKIIDDQEYVLKAKDISLEGGTGIMQFSLNTGLAGEKVWYPVSDEDPDRYLLLTAFGGCLGFHKFATGRIGEGLFYFLTCGCLGVLPAIDIYLQMRGSAYYYVDDYETSGKMSRSRKRQKFYIKRPSNTLLAIVLVFVAVGLGILLANTLYAWALKVITAAIINSASNMSEEQVMNVVNKLEPVISP